MIDHELTDPAGGALTITHDHQGVWVTATEDRDEVTVGPFPARALRASFDMGGDDMDGGVTAAAIENEADGKAMWEKTRTDHLSPERARSLVQENDELRARIGRVEEARDLYRRDVLTEERLHGEARRFALAWKETAREQTRRTRTIAERTRVQADYIGRMLREREEARAATASPRPLSADDITDDARDQGREAYWTWRDEGSGSINGLVRAILHAALPEPVRPEGAEEIEGPLRQVLRLNGQAPDETTVSALSDALAERGVRAGGDS